MSATAILPKTPRIVTRSVSEELDVFSSLTLRVSRRLRLGVKRLNMRHLLLSHPLVPRVAVDSDEPIEMSRDRELLEPRGPGLCIRSSFGFVWPNP